MKEKGSELLQMFETTKYFKYENDQYYHFDYMKLLLFFILYSDSKTEDHDYKVQLLFHLMTDEQPNIVEGRPAVISCTRGSARRVIEILQTLSSKLPTEIIQDSMQQYQGEPADQEHFDTIDKVLV